MKKRVITVVRMGISPGFFVLRRKSTGLWELPGGRIDLGETIMRAAVRETHEELGVHVRDTTKVGSLVIKRHGNHVKLHLFHAIAMTNDAYIAEPDIFDAIRFATKADLEFMNLAKSLNKARTFIA